MAKTKAELMAPARKEPLVRVRVTRRGHGRISTGVHTQHGDELYEQGEEFEVSESIAKALVGEDLTNPDNTKDWVEIIGEVKARDPLDHDGDGVKGGFNHGDSEVKRGPGRPRKDAE